jgi:GxxExxY protein
VHKEISQREQRMDINSLSKDIIGVAIEVHSALGPGLLESAYSECLSYKLNKMGFKVEREKPLPLIFEEVKLDCGYRMDIVVEDQIVIEVKSVETLNDIHLAQILTYLKLGNYKLGLLMNFNVVLLKYGLKRVVNNL